MTRSALEAHHRDYYSARNLVLAVAGPVEHAKALELAARHFGDIGPGTVAEETPPPPWPGGPRLIDVPHEESQTELRLTFPAPFEQHPDFPGVMAIRRIVSFR